MEAPILVATDFSPAGQSALAYAARLAAAQHRQLLVVHAQVLMPPLSDPAMPGDMVPQMAYRELLADHQEKASGALSDLREQLSRSFPGLAVSTNQLDAGNMASALNEFALKTSPLLIVIGTHERHGAESWDSNGLSLLRQSKFPLLVVPEAVGSEGWQKAALAWDGAAIEPAQQGALTDLSAALALQVDAVYVQKEGGAAMPSTSMPPGVEIHNITAADISEGLQQFTAAGGHNLLIVLPHHHNLWERLFFKLHTPGLVSESRLPVLVIPG